MFDIFLTAAFLSWGIVLGMILWSLFKELD
jgi:hypothetical protein